MDWLESRVLSLYKKMKYMSGEGISRAAKTTIRMERWRNMKKVNALYRERQNKATKPKATSSVSTTKANNKKRSPATV